MDWWGLSKTDKGGIITILLISLLVYSYRYYAKWFIPVVEIDTTKLIRARAQLDSLQAADSLTQLVDFKIDPIEKGKDLVVDSFFGSPININMASVPELIDLDLDSTLADRIVRFRYTIERFEKWQDLKKVYGISESLKPYFLKRIYFGSIDTTFAAKRKWDPLSKDKDLDQNAKQNQFSNKYEIQIIELNTATYEQLLMIKGIGGYFAKSILENREKLGGYFQLSQLLDIYKLDTTVLGRISPYLSIDTAVIQRIQINKVEAEELYAHPYITYKQANQIVNYRIQHGLYLKPTDLLKIQSLTDQWLRKVTPYISFELN